MDDYLVEQAKEMANSWRVACNTLHAENEALKALVAQLEQKIESLEERLDGAGEALMGDDI